MITKTVGKGVAILLIVLSAFLGACDRFHEAHVIIDPRKPASEGNMPRQVAEEKVFSIVVLSSVKEFAAQMNLTCGPSRRPLFLLDCGPHGDLNLRKEDGRFIVTFFQTSGDPGHFCNVQGRLFEYFPLVFGESTITVGTNDACGRKNDP